MHECCVYMFPIPVFSRNAIFICQFCILNAHLLSRQMTNPAIQNDFSYYRRTLSRMRIINQTVSKPALYGNMPHYHMVYVLVILRSPVSQGLMGALLLSNGLNH